MNVIYDPGSDRPGGKSVRHSQGQERNSQEGSLHTPFEGSRGLPPHPLLLRADIAHRRIDSDTVCKELYDQIQIKAPGLDHINFKALQLLWSWDSERVVALV